MPKTLKTKTELEAMLLSELQQAPNCMKSRSVTICRAEDQSAGVTWLVTDYESGEGRMLSCAAMIEFIERRLQSLYDLTPDEQE
jgi:hypothetical protein